MDEKRMPGDRPEAEVDGGDPFTAEAPEHDSAAKEVVPVVGIGASAGGLEVFKLLLGDLPAEYRPGHRGQPRICHTGKR